MIFKCVVNSKNVYSLPELITLAETLKVKNLTLAFLHPVGRAKSEMNDMMMEKDDFNELFELIREHGINKKIEITLKTPPAIIPSKLFTEIPKG